MKSWCSIMNKFILGLTGAFGSGCTEITNKFIVTKGFEYISLSDILREEYKTRYGSLEGLSEREALQDFGNELRKNNRPDILARKAIEKINSMSGNFIVIDSIRNPLEIELLRKEFVDFYLIGIFANQEVRWNRVKGKYQNNNIDFERDEKRDKGEDFDYGQKVTECFLNSDLIISNNETIMGYNDAYKIMDAKITKYLSLLQNPYKQLPQEMETLMAIAYANSQRSSCQKRKVGAIIVDDFGNIFSSGYNEVPTLDKPCANVYGGCYRDHVRNDLKTELLGKNISQEDTNSIIKKFKVLEKCRALHAEENAILNVARFGSANAVKGATLYTTTYPCNLCANKISQVGISEMVYFEPYPVLEAKRTLDEAEIVQTPFEGITFKSYFKIYGEIQT